MRIVELEIKNWEKHNPRTDVKTARWFKMSNEFFSDPEFYGVSLEARAVWMFFLCTASKKSSGNIKVNTQMIADLLRIRVESVDYAVQELERCGSILTNPVTLVSDDLRPERKDKVTKIIRALEEKREEEIRREEKREEYICTELGVADSVPKVVRKFGAIPTLSKNDEVIALLKTVPHDSQALWIKTYNDVPWILSEFSKIIIWLNCNPRRAPKSRMNAFISTWLGRSWEALRKTLPGQFVKAEHRTVPELTDRQIELLKEAGQI